MKIRQSILLLLAAGATAAFSGCTSMTNVRGKTQTVILGGLFEMREGVYEAEPAGTLPLNGEKPAPGSKLTGTKVSVLWGLVSYRDQ